MLLSRSLLFARKSTDQISIPLLLSFRLLRKGQHRSRCCFLLLLVRLLRFVRVVLVAFYVRGSSRSSFPSPLANRKLGSQVRRLLRVSSAVFFLDAYPLELTSFVPFPRSVSTSTSFPPPRPLRLPPPLRPPPRPTSSFPDRLGSLLDVSCLADVRHRLLTSGSFLFLGYVDTSPYILSGSMVSTSSNTFVSFSSVFCSIRLFLKLLPRLQSHILHHHLSCRRIYLRRSRM
jgi:hypothetical protein